MEKWDLYNSNLEKTGISVSNVDEIPNDSYHIAIDIWVINNKKEILLVKNSVDYTKLYPDCWVSIGGNIQSGEDVTDCIRRIIKNELNLELNELNYELQEPVKRDPHKYAYMTCILFENIDMNQVRLDDSNFIDVKFLSKNELVKMCNNGEIAYYLIERINSKILKYLN